MTNQAPRQRGKRAERDVARRLRAKRTRVMGVRAPDIESSWLIGEVKNYQKAPELPYRYLKQLRAMDTKNRLPVFIFKRPDWRDYIICCFLRDFEDWSGETGVK